MENLRIYTPLADGGRWELEAECGRELVETLLTDDREPSPEALVIEAKGSAGDRVRIYIPCDDRQKAYVRIHDA